MLQAAAAALADVKKSGTAAAISERLRALPTRSTRCRLLPPRVAQPHPLRLLRVDLISQQLRQVLPPLPLPPLFPRRSPPPVRPALRHARQVEQQLAKHGGSSSLHAIERSLATAEKVLRRRRPFVYNRVWLTNSQGSS
jgi:hypothetical protein